LSEAVVCFSRVMLMKDSSPPVLQLSHIKVMMRSCSVFVVGLAVILNISGTAVCCAADDVDLQSASAPNKPAQPSREDATGIVDRVKLEAKCVRLSALARQYASEGRINEALVKQCDLVQGLESLLGESALHTKNQQRFLEELQQVVTQSSEQKSDYVA